MWNTLNLPVRGGSRPLRRLLAASISLAPPRLYSSCTHTSSIQDLTHSSVVSLPRQRIRVLAVSRANSVSSVLQEAPLLKSVVTW